VDVRTVLFLHLQEAEDSEQQNAKNRKPEKQRGKMGNRCSAARLLH